MAITFLLKQLSAAAEKLRNKELNDVVIEVQKYIIERNTEFIELQGAMCELRQENSKLKEENSELRREDEYPPEAYIPKPGGYY